MLPDVDPGIMPTTGSRADLGLLRAGKLLNQAGADGGQVLLIADGVPASDATATERAAARLKSEGYRVSVLGVGTKEGAPLTNAQGELVRNASGNIVDVRLDTSTLKAVARAGGGEYRTISDNGQALRALLAQPMDAKTTIKANATTQGWKEQGPLLAVLLLPLAALAFRRNWLLGLLLLAGLSAPPRPALASTWTDLWQRRDQQAAKALAAGDYAKAAALATNAAWRGSAEYKRGDYKLALDNFSRATGADADYNRGNALAKLGKYRDAIAAYDKSLKENPADADARANKAAVEALLKKQRKQQVSGSQGKQSRNGHGGGGQNSAQGKAGEQGSKQAQSSPNGGASGQGQQAANANQAGKGTHKGEPSGANGKNSQNAASGTASSGSAAAQQPKSGNQFAAAAKKLAQQRHGMTQAQAKQASRATPGANSGANATDQMRAANNAARQSANADADSAQPLSREEQLAAQEWLRRIPDDPGGLLRRKFLYEYRQRQLHRGSAD
jgi:Ca-activated chloride channel homolog